MRPTPEFNVELRRDRIKTARQLTPEQKLRAGPELYDLARELAKTGIRAQHPEFQEHETQQLLRERMAMKPFQELAHDLS